MDVVSVLVFLATFLVFGLLALGVFNYGARERTYEEAMEEQRRLRRQQQELEEAKRRRAKNSGGNSKSNNGDLGSNKRKPFKSKKSNVEDDEDNNNNKNHVDDNKALEWRSKGLSHNKTVAPRTQKVPQPQPVSTALNKVEEVQEVAKHSNQTEKKEEKAVEIATTDTLVDANSRKSNAVTANKNAKGGNNINSAASKIPVSVENRAQRHSGEGATDTGEGTKVDLNQGTKSERVIEDIQAIPIQEQEQQQQHPTVSQNGRKKKEKKKESGSNNINNPKPIQNGSVSTMSASEVTSLAKRTAFDDVEAQQLIDILLLKQSGEVSNGAWIDTSNPKQTNDVEKLRRFLEEKEEEVKEEQIKMKSLRDKMTLLRNELNQSKASVTAALQARDEANNRHQMELNNLQMNFGQERDQLRRELQRVQAQLQVQTQHVQQLQSNMDQLEASRQQLAAKPQFDPQLASELEQLRVVKTQLESELKQTQMESKNTVDQLKLRIKEVEQGYHQSVTDCNTLQQEKKVLEVKLKEQSGHLLQQEQKMQQMTSQGQKTETQSSKIMEENDRLRNESQVLQERLSDLQQDLDSVRQALTNVEAKEDDSETTKRLEGEKNKLEANCDQLRKQNQELLKERTAVESKVSSNEEELKRLKEELSQQRSKNDELRSKNWKAMEALTNTEQAYQRLLQDKSSKEAPSKEKLNAEDKTVGTDVLDQARRALESEVRSAISATFPDINAGDGQSFDKWLGDFAMKIAASDDNANEELKDKLSKTENQLATHVATMKRTEEMLYELQSSVESEESRWKEKLNDREEDLDRMKNENAELKLKINQLTDSIQVVGHAEEMQKKLEELQRKLSDEESEKAVTLQQLDASNKKIEELQKSHNDSSELRAKFEAECGKNKELAAKVAQLDQLVHVGQEALHQERNRVDLLSCDKNVSSVTENGPSRTDAEPTNVEANEALRAAAPTPTSTTSSGSSNQRKKSPKKKVSAH